MIRMIHWMLSLILTTVIADAQMGATAIVSLSSTGNQGDHWSTERASISADDRFVAFQSLASNLVPNDTNFSEDIFVRDRVAQITTRVSRSGSGEEGNQTSLGPVISANGRYVAFSSQASNLVPGDSNGSNDVFIHDRDTGQIQRVSVSNTGFQGDGSSNGPIGISDDGRFVSFVSYATNLVTGDTNGMWDVFVRDRLNNTISRVSVSSSGTQSDGWSLACSISGDGRWVVFDSTASNLVQGDTNNRRDIFLHDRLLGMTTRISVSSSGVQGNLDSGYPSISTDGRVVVFESEATNLVPDDLNSRQDIFLHEVPTSQTRRVSVSTLGTDPNRSSRHARCNRDGRYVVFSSEATNLVPSDTNGRFDVFLRDTRAGHTLRVSVSSGQGQGNGHSWWPGISENGSLVAFSSQATNLVAGDSNGWEDVFCHVPLARVSGVVTLGGFVGPMSGADLEAQCWQGGQLVESLQAPVASDGSFSFSPITNGSVLLKMRYRTGLWKGFAVTLGSTPIVGLTVGLINGDCDDDNEVSIGDYAVLSSAFGSSPGSPTWNPMADLDGDEEVSIGDFAILSGNFGEVGD